MFIASAFEDQGQTIKEYSCLQYKKHTFHDRTFEILYTVLLLFLICCTYRPNTATANAGVAKLTPHTSHSILPATFTELLKCSI